MILDIQIKTLFYSFLFGIYFSFIIYINYKYIYKLKKLYKVITTFIFIFFNTIMYFLILLKINNGIIHIYGLISLIIGFLLEHYIQNIIENHIKK